MSINFLIFSHTLIIQKFWSHFFFTSLYECYLARRAACCDSTFFPRRFLVSLFELFSFCSFHSLSLSLSSLLDFMITHHLLFLKQCCGCVRGRQFYTYKHNFFTPACYSLLPPCDPQIEYISSTAQKNLNFFFLLSVGRFSGNWKAK